MLTEKKTKNNRVSNENGSPIPNKMNYLKNSKSNAAEDGFDQLYADQKMELLKLAEENRHNPLLFKELVREQREMLTDRQFGQTDAIYHKMKKWEDKISLLDERTIRIETLLSTVISLLVERQLGVSDKEYERWIKRNSLPNSLEELS